MAVQEYVCAICGYKSGNRAEFVEFNDPIKLPKAIEMARARGRDVSADSVKYVCINCSVRLYEPEASH
jgi:DNA-directed RNA polymerase subunit RPC12/RpoP